LDDIHIGEALEKSGVSGLNSNLIIPDVYTRFVLNLYPTEPTSKGRTQLWKSPTTNETSGATNVDPEFHTEFALMQYEQLIDSFQAQLKLLVQIIAALVIANVTVVGYAFTEKIASILLISALFPITIYFLMVYIYRLALPLMYSAVSIESQYGNSQIDWLMSSFVGFTNSFEYLKQLNEISVLTDPKERITRLHNITSPWIGSGKGFGRLALLLAAVCQIALSIALGIFAGWHYI
jgi:hypothetical protein